MRVYTYASAPDVIRHLTFVATFTATSRPNATQVDGHLDDAANELDAALTLADYSIPIATAATVSFEILRSWNAVGAACFSARSMPQGSDSKHAQALCERFSSILDGIRAGDFALPDADKETTRGRARFGAIATGASPYFTRQGVFDR